MADKTETKEKKISTTIVPVLVLEVLKKYSCRKVQLTKAQIMEYIDMDYGLKLPDDKVVGRAIAALRDVAGYDIISTPGRAGGNYIEHTNGLENDQLKNVIDMVKGNLADIRRAINKKKKITFDYMRYNCRGELEVRKGHKVSPSDVIYQNSRYYLIGVDEKKQTVTNFRIDHIANVNIVDEKAIPVTGYPSYEKGITNERVRKMLPNMVADIPVRITAIVDSIRLDQLMDIYKDAMIIRPKGKDEFIIEVETSPKGFRYLALQHLDGMKVIAPSELKDDITKRLKDGLDKYKGKK